MCPTFARCIVLICLTAPLMAQTAAPDANTPSATLRINGRSVLVDVVVTDKNGKPVLGLKRDAFAVTEQGKPQMIGYFEEHTAAPAEAPTEMPKFPPDVFSNFSPFPLPAAVNVLLLDSLNTRMESQMVVHQQAMKFLKDLKPGSRMAIFTMDMGLHYVQGFTDDPTLLLAALGDKKNNEVQNSVMVTGQEETNAHDNLVGMMGGPPGNLASSASPAMIGALQNFMRENVTSQKTGNVLLTMANLKRLATFLNGFPGRKNVIWFSESPMLAERLDPQTEDEWERTRNMLAAARVALYPVDARGVSTIGFYQADSQLNGSINSASQVIGPSGAQSMRTMAEDVERNSEQMQMQRIAEETGGRSFVNTNGLSEVMAKITADSTDFYTISYAPTNGQMDGTYRDIGVKVTGGNFNLSYRRGYYARDAGLPGGALATREKAVDKLAAQNEGAVDPLLPFMDLGMPESEQILYMARIQPMGPKAGNGPQEQSKAKDSGQTYAVDLSVVLKDLSLKLDSDGLHKGTLNISLIVYDRYGKIANRKDHLVALNFKPDVYAAYQQTGLPMHAEIEVPKGQYWLRTGVYDQGSRKVGTLEIALSSVVPLQAAPATPRP